MLRTPDFVDFQDRDVRNNKDQYTSNSQAVDLPSFGFQDAVGKDDLEGDNFSDEHEAVADKCHLFSVQLGQRESPFAKMLDLFDTAKLEVSPLPMTAYHAGTDIQRHEMDKIFLQVFLTVLIFPTETVFLCWSFLLKSFLLF